MLYMEWDESLSVDQGPIDNDHRHLFELTNRFQDAILAGEAQEQLSVILKALIDYAATHFRREEYLMQATRFPEYAEHKAAHDQFVQQVLDMKARLEAGTPVLTLEVSKFLRQWLLKHIATRDKRLSALRP